jgi:hypothetical protein
MKVKVNYEKIWHNTTVYSQTITLKTNVQYFVTVNNRIIEALDRLKDLDYQTSEEASMLMYCKPLKFGENYCTLSQLRLIVDEFNLKTYERIKLDRNTKLIIDIKS